MIDVSNLYSEGRPQQGYRFDHLQGSCIYTVDDRRELYASVDVDADEDPSYSYIVIGLTGVSLTVVLGRPGRYTVGIATLEFDGF